LSHQLEIDALKVPVSFSELVAFLLGLALLACKREEESSHTQKAHLSIGCQVSLRSAHVKVHGEIYKRGPLALIKDIHCRWRRWK
jgi:hypothetical protein